LLKVGVRLCHGSGAIVLAILDSVNRVNLPQGQHFSLQLRWVGAPGDQQIHQGTQQPVD